jgi:enoyl-[acyl-carrier protein] reductase II
LRVFKVKFFGTIHYTSAGNPAKYAERIKEAGVRVIHKVSNLREGKKAEGAGVDAVVAMGYEAGGIIGRSGISSFCLIPELADNLNIPVIAAGGIADARGFAAAMILGAEGVEIGTRLLATKECPVPGKIKEAVLKSTCDSTIVLESPVVMRVLRPELTGSDSPAPAGQVSGIIKEILSVKEVIERIVDQKFVEF